MTGQRLENLLREYDVLYLNKLKCFFESPINHLYKELATVNRASYNSNQRIVRSAWWSVVVYELNIDA